MLEMEDPARFRSRVASRASILCVRRNLTRYVTFLSNINVSRAVIFSILSLPLYEQLIRRQFVASALQANSVGAIHIGSPEMPSRVVLMLQ